MEVSGLGDKSDGPKPTGKYKVLLRGICRNPIDIELNLYEHPEINRVGFASIDGLYKLLMKDKRLNLADKRLLQHSN